MPYIIADTPKIAKAIMHNPTNGAFDYAAVLYMGINQAVMDEQPFSLNAGQSKEIAFNVTMPSIVGDFPVFVDVYSGGKLLAHREAVETVYIGDSMGGIMRHIIEHHPETIEHVDIVWN